jgi:serine/threonine protein kinase
MSSLNNSQFKIEQKLNESATTVVYQAFDEVLHRTVLLKVLHKHLANDHDLRERFTREARACAALHSEHIVQIYDLTEIDGAPAIVMEFVNGRSLKDVIASGAARSVETAKKVGIHVLRALAAAHERGIIHRDIKPGNILVSDKGVVKVTDFGLAYVALSPTVTMEGMVLGTPAYMAPEQVRGDEIDHRTDLFALGVTLAETLTGERIFEGSTYSECLKKVLAFTVQDVERFSDRSTPEFSAFLKKLLHPSKAERFATAQDALEALGEHQPVSGSGAATQPPLQKQRKNLIPAGIALTVLLAIIIIGWITLTPSGTQQQPTETIPPTDSIREDQSVRREELSEQPAQTVSSPVSAPFPERTTALAITKSVTDSGRLLLTSTPWAKVYVDNRLIGETPIAKPLTLAAGTHTVMFANPAFDPIVTNITLEPGRETTVTGNFIEHAGYLKCVASPWAEVYVDEQYKDTTPMTKPLMLSAGKHTVRFKNTSFPDIIREITMQPKDTTFITVSFTP